MTNKLFTLDDFTPEREAKVPGYIKKYTDGIYDGKRYATFSEEKAKALIDWNYTQCGFQPPVMLVAENPYEAQVYFNILKANQEYYMPFLYLTYCLQHDLDIAWFTEDEDAKLDDKLTDKLDDKLDAKLDDKLHDKLHDKLRAKLHAKLYAKLDAKLTAKLTDKLHDKLDDKLDDKLTAKLRAKLRAKLYAKLDAKLYAKLHAKLHAKLRAKLYAKLDAKLYAKLDAKLTAKLRAKLHDKLDDKLDDKLTAKLTAKLYAKLRAKLYAKLEDKLDAKLCAKLRAKLRAKLDDRLGDSRLGRFPDYLFTANIWSNVYAAYYKFIKDEFNIEIEEGPMLDTWDNLYLDSGVYAAIFSEIVCIVSKYPKKIHIDNRDELHCLTGSAVEWGCETELTSFDNYYIHGRAIEDKIFKQAATLQASDFINETNDEVRSAWFEILGSEKIIQLLDAEKVDSVTIIHHNGESETIEYYRTKENLNRFKNEPYAWRKVMCPSTGTTYFTPTNPALKTALEVAKFHRPDWVPNEIDYSWYSRS